jgi:hypothetical protein
LVCLILSLIARFFLFFVMCWSELVLHL